VPALLSHLRERICRLCGLVVHSRQYRNFLSLGVSSPAELAVGRRWRVGAVAEEGAAAPVPAVPALETAPELSYDDFEPWVDQDDQRATPEVCMSAGVAIALEAMLQATEPGVVETMGVPPRRRAGRPSAECWTRTGR
jgi:hypothetical protein